MTIEIHITDAKTLSDDDKMRLIFAVIDTLPLDRAEIVATYAEGRASRRSLSVDSSARRLTLDA